MPNISFSVLMPAARTTYLREAVEAVLAQTYPHWQLIIKTLPNTAVFEVLDGLDLRKVTIVFGEDSGITDAVNQAWKFATGDFCMWANDDDVLRPNALENIVNAIPSIDPHVHQLQTMWGFGQIQCSDGSIRGCDCDLEGLKQSNLISQPAVFWRNCFKDDPGYFNEEFDLASDYEYWTRLMKLCKPLYIDKILAWYRIHPKQASNLETGLQAIQASAIRDRI